MKQWRCLVIFLFCVLLCACQNGQISKAEQDNNIIEHALLEPISSEAFARLVQEDCYITQEELDTYSVYKFLGTWEALQYIETGAIHNLKNENQYKGNRFYLGKHSYYNDTYAEINAPLERIEQYYIQKELKLNFEIYYKLYAGLKEVIPIEEKEIYVLYSQEKDNGYGKLVGIILDENHLLSYGGTGWYKYERVEEAVS